MLLELKVPFFHCAVTFDMSCSNLYHKHQAPQHCYLRDCFWSPQKLGAAATAAIARKFSLGLFGSPCPDQKFRAGESNCLGGGPVPGPGPQGKRD